MNIGAVWNVSVLDKKFTRVWWVYISGYDTTYTFICVLNPNKSLHYFTDSRLKKN